MRVSLVLAAVFTAGVTLRAWAIHELGSSYSHRLTTIPALVTDGPYRLLRHPAYAGMLLASLAFTADFLTPASIVTLTLLVAAVIWRIRVEERLLGTRADYREFASTRARMLPGVW